MLLSWWRGNRFMHIKFCCLQLHPGKDKMLPLWRSLWLFHCLFSFSFFHVYEQNCGAQNSCDIPGISSVSSRFKSLLQNRPAAENTCIEISHVKYNIFHVRSLLYYLLFLPVRTYDETKPKSTMMICVFTCRVS